MPVNPDAPLELTQDLARATTYGAWASQFKNGGAPDGLSEYGAWGHVARWLAQKGAEDLTIRGVGVVAPNLLVRALDVEPSRQLGLPPALYQNPVVWHGPRTPLGENTRGNQRSLRGMLLWGVNRSSDKVIETWGPGAQLAVAVAKAIESDPDPAVRLEALKMVSQAAFPVQRWATAILPALDRTQATLAEQPWDTSTRRAMQKWISDARSRLLSLLAQAQGLPGGDFIAPPAPHGLWTYVRHNPVIVAGLGLAAVIAAVVGVRAAQRRRRLT